MEKKSTSPTSTKAPSVASFAPSRKSRGGGGGSVFGEEKRTMSMKDVLVWRKITKRWHDRVMERNSSRNGGFCWVRIYYRFFLNQIYKNHKKYRADSNKSLFDVATESHRRRFVTFTVFGFIYFGYVCVRS